MTLGDPKIRRVKVLGDRAKAAALKIGCKDEDLVLVTTIIKPNTLPEYKIEKVIGSPTDWLLERAKRVK
jgi:hypothetical protein